MKGDFILKRIKRFAVVLGLIAGMMLTAGCQKPAAETVAPTETEPASELVVETETETETEEVSDGTPDSFLLYLSGIDVRGDVTEVGRSDVNILMAVNRITHKVQLVNTPRDYFVYLPNSGSMRDKLTHAGIYGIDVSKGAMETLYDVDIDYYVRLNFSGFKMFINAIDGIDVYSEYTFTGNNDKVYEAGMNSLNGKEALAFVRERKSFEKGDVQRGINQMEMVKALVAKLTSADILKTYDYWMDDELKLDYETNIPADLLQSLIRRQLTENPDWDIETYYVTGTGSKDYTYSIPSSKAYVMLPNEEEVAEGTRLLKETLNTEEIPETEEVSETLESEAETGE